MLNIVKYTKTFQNFCTRTTIHTKVFFQTRNKNEVKYSLHVYSSLFSSKRFYNINAQERICSMINRTKIVIFIRGRPKTTKGQLHTFTECKESQSLVELLETAKVYYEAIDILTDYNAEEGIKEFSQTDEIPQIYLKGNLFKGGVKELLHLKDAGKLNELFEAINVRRKK